MLAVSNLHRKFSSSVQSSYNNVNRSFSEACTQSDEVDIHAIIDIIQKNENPFCIKTACNRLHNIVTNKIVPEDISDQLLNVEDIGERVYTEFRENRFLFKTKRISETIHRNNLKTFASVHQVPTSKKIIPIKKLKSKEVAIKKTIDIAQMRGQTMEELLKYDISSSSYLFDNEGFMTSATKNDPTEELEKRLPDLKHKEPRVDSIPTAYLFDVMANIRKIKTRTRETKTFGDFVCNFLTFVKNTANSAQRIDLIFDSYLEKTIKDSERKKRARTSAVELNKIKKDTHLPVKMENFGHQTKTRQILKILFTKMPCSFHGVSIQRKLLSVPMV